MDPSRPEQQIAHGLRDGQRDAWRAMYDAYARQVWCVVARQMGSDAADVADVVQETFLAAARSVRQYDPARGSLWMWLYGFLAVVHVLQQRTCRILATSNGRSGWYGLVPHDSGR